MVQVLKSGCRWCDCPPEYGPATTIYNRFAHAAFPTMAGGSSSATSAINET
jgi:transposase